MIKLMAVFFLALSVLACGTQLPREVSMPVIITQEPTAQTVNMSVSEPTDTAPRYMTTGALNVREQANASSTILGTLAPFTEITIFVIDQTGDDCYLGEWYQIDYKPEGGETVKAYICSLWVVKK